MNFLNEQSLRILIRKHKLENYEAELVKEIGANVETLVREKIKHFFNKQRIVNVDNAKKQSSPRQVLSLDQIDKLPSWVKEDIDNSTIVGEPKKVIQTSDGRKYHLNNPLNDLSGGEWTFFLNSVISTRYSTGGAEGFAHRIRKIHPSPKPPQLMRDIIKFFTKENELVLDYFMGVGGTLLGASLSNRRAIGIDLESKYIQAYKEACHELGLDIQHTLQGDSVEILKKTSKLDLITKGEQFSLILIDPPYGDMMARKKTGEAAKKGKDTSATPFTNLNTDLGNFTWAKFREIFQQSVIDAMKLLKTKGHLVVFIKDLQPDKNQPNLHHAELTNDLCKIDGLNYRGTKIWADLGVNLYPYGYPYSYVSNQIHQYILIFRKER